MTRPLAPDRNDDRAAEAPARRLKIVVLRDKYQSGFMSPRQSAHNIARTRFLPFNKLKAEWDGFTVLPPVRGTDLVHAHNRIPMGAGRFICSFESIVPRDYGVPKDSLIWRAMAREIDSSRCRRLVAMSHAAKLHFVNQHRGLPSFEKRMAKLIVRHPSVQLGAAEDSLPGGSADRLVVTFVGAHFGRKGGAACVRAAELALARKLPVSFNIVSSLQTGASSWIDPTLPGFFEPYLQKLNLPNVRHFHSMPNGEVRALLRGSHFTLLPTVSDSFGYSMIESMAEHTPVIASRVTAVPEVIAEGHNGFMLDLPVTAAGDWIAPDYAERGTPHYAEHFRLATESLALQLVERLEAMIGQRETLQRLRRNAYLTAKHMFCADTHGAFWDRLYARVNAEDIGREPELDPVLDASSPSDPLACLGDRFV